VTASRQQRRAPPRPPAASRPARKYRLARWIGVLAVLGLLAAILAVTLRSSSETPAASPTTGPMVAPAHLTRSGSIPVGTGPVRVVVYFDYLCPACGAFEDANGSDLERLLETDDITVELRPIAFLDHLSDNTRYSTRSANALATVVDGAPEQVWAFHRALFAHQPAEGSEGLTDDELAAIAVEAGVPASVAARFEQARFEAWTAERTDRAFADGVQGTPTILVGGRVFDGDPFAPGSLSAAVDEATR
jgi:protein-disulfide isomerase